MREERQWNATHRIGRAFDEGELIGQQYRRFVFWARVLNFLILAFFLTCFLKPEALGLLVLGIVGRLALAIVKAYYRQVYRVSG